MNLETQSESARPQHPAEAQFTRRQVAAYAAMLLGSLSCTSVRMLLDAYPQRYDRDEDLVDDALRAFVTTVIPSAPLDDPNLVRVFGDPEFPFHSHRGYFIYDLCSRSRKLAGMELSTEVPLRVRTRLVQKALEDGGLTEQLYRGAIYLAQAAFYGGIYEPGGCALIDFPGPNHGFSRDELYYEDAERYLAREITTDGNLA